MVQRGVPFEMVAKFLGNSKEMVERVYGHHSPEWLRLAANALSRQVAEKTGTWRDSCRFTKLSWCCWSGLN